MRLALNNKSVFTESKRVRFWPKADINGGILGHISGHVAVYLNSNLIYDSEPKKEVVVIVELERIKSSTLMIDGI